VQKLLKRIEGSMHGTHMGPVKSTSSDLPNKPEEQDIKVADCFPVYT
jgi:hypothetical protein